jgi:hypothetical protein
MVGSRVADLIQLCDDLHTTTAARVPRMNDMSTHRLPLHRSIPAIATLAVILTGCSMGVSSEPTETMGENTPAVENSQGETGSQAPEGSTPEQTDPTTDPAETPTEETDAETPTGPVEAGTELTREELLKEVRKQLRCPDGTLTIDGVSPRVEIIDDCDGGRAKGRASAPAERRV